MPKLHLFDLDGTLMYGSAAPVEISRQLGLIDEVAVIEQGFSRGELTPHQVAEGLRDLWSELTDAHVQAAFEGAPWLAGIRDVWAEIREVGDYCAVVSLSPDFFVNRLLEWGAHDARGSRFPEVPFRRPVDPAGILSPAAKVKIAEELCTRFRVTTADCIAYGDSLSDADLFAAVPLSVAVNGDRHVSSLASCAYRGRDLREAYELAGNHVRDSRKGITHANTPAGAPAGEFPRVGQASEITGFRM